jgi:hypothetical protein
MQIPQKLECWKNHLLDLGKRNRLIHCALPNPNGRISRTMLLIYNPSMADLWNRFTTDNTSPLQFPVFDKDLYDNVTEQENLSQNNDFSNGVTTNLSPVETDKTLRQLMKKEKAFTEEKGINALFIAFGFLNWKEHGANGQDMRSPLLLVPVALTQESLNDPICLSRSDDEISVNKALEQKLHNDFNISLPQFEEADNWQAYLSQVQQTCSSLKWQVENNVACLSMFDFLKINIYHDLERNAEKIMEHPIVRALNLDIKDINSGIDCSIKEINHDTVEPKDIFSVVDADSSQQDAILLAKRGASFILQGPPGTGKSQTITNIIAELIADGKKVLFVSEKMAALEVVFKRLKQAELEAFCLTLHSHNAKRREILDQLQLSLNLSQNRGSLNQEALNKLYQLQEARTALNTYTQELHTEVAPLGYTIFQVNGFIARYGSYTNLDYVQKNAESFTEERLTMCRTALKELSYIVKKSGYQNDNPWNGCIVEDLTHEFRQRFLTDTEKLLSFIENGVCIYNNIISLTEAITFPTTFISIQDTQNLLSIAKKSPLIPFEWLKLDLPELIKTVANCSISSKKTNELNDFCENLKQHVGTLLTAIHQVINCTLNADTKNRKDYNDGFAFASNNFIALFSTEDISLKLTTFREWAESVQRLTDEYEQTKNDNAQIDNTLSEITRSLENEQKKLDQNSMEWQNAKDLLAEAFDETVISVNVANILFHYRTLYRSRLRRFFSMQYSHDKKLY